MHTGKQPRMSNLAISIPLLENGDRLTREEFEHRYDAMPHLKKAELIEGIVHMASSLRFESHAEPHGFIIGWLAVYCASTPGIRLADNASVRLDMDNEVQPDALLRLPESFGGRSQITRDDYLQGAPELIVEVAASSAAYDLHGKRKAYCRNGV
ncbi:MAG: Uma2 family endonuclease, partial [Gammaproteobacteria bacterium]|nr:Uma2 family endonuclease [Gammaproteobacteria bacterium]